MANLLTAQARLNAARARRRRRQMGPPLDVAPDALAIVATVSDLDQPEVEAFVRSVAGERGVEMLRTE